MKNPNLPKSKAAVWFANLFAKKSDKTFSIEEIIALLQTTPEALAEFEKLYQYALASESDSDKAERLFGGFSSKEVRERILERNDSAQSVPDLESVIKRIVCELLNSTDGYAITDDNIQPVTYEEVMALPEGVRPELTGSFMTVSFNNFSYLPVFEMYKKYLESGDKMAYQMFRQGLDMLDLDPVLYETLGLNKNSIGYWFPKLEKAASYSDFFKIPQTKIVKVPPPILQLSRMEYTKLTPTTLDIVNRWAYEAFELEEEKTYFVKTGLFSSKFDFRNAKVAGAQEVRELGSYLLYIHYLTVTMASPLAMPPIYGAATTNEWCVREYIPDVENNPCIYNGMPLHTEYRVFVDCDTDRILGITPYWRPDVMKARLCGDVDSYTLQMKHDAVVYCQHEKTLMTRYFDNREAVVKAISEILPYIDLPGQWSIDIMQNGDTFWLIDMGEAARSALNDCVPPSELKAKEEYWIPRIPDCVKEGD